jgi:microcin C transport system permease protein
MMKFSPEFNDKVRKFRKNKRALWSLRILVVLFLLTLPAELLMNDKPIAMRIDGNWFFPVFKSYTYKDLGGTENSPVVDYSSKIFKTFLEGKDPIINTDVLYADIAPEGKELVTYTDGEKRDSWMLWPLIHYSYRSSPSNDALSVQRLANPFSHTDNNGEKVTGAASVGHLLGTDQFGKDVFARLVYGFRLSLVFGLALAISSTLLGCILGGMQGYFGGLIDLLGQRMTEIWGAIPRLMLLMILSDFLSRQGKFTEWQHLMMLFIIMNLTSWMGMASHMRAQFLRARNLDYVRAAKSLGVANSRIMFRHILPNSLTPIITFLPFSVSSSIFALVGLDFLGFGLKYPAPSLGELLAQGQQNLHAWWIMVPTFVTLSMLMILLTFVGDGVRNAFDPRYKG